MSLLPLFQYKFIKLNKINEKESYEKTNCLEKLLSKIYFYLRISFYVESGWAAEEELGGPRALSVGARGGNLRWQPKRELR